MDNTLQDLLTLVEKGSVEQRCAALLVLGALKISNAATAKLVGTLLDSANPVLKDYALRYFEEVQPKNNPAQLLKMLDDGDKEMQERAVRSLTGVGQAAVTLLIQGSQDATRVWQMNAARVLAAVRGKAALKGLLQMLSGGTDETNKVICDLLTPALREMEGKELDAFYDEVERFAAKLDVKQQRPAAVSTMRLLGQLGRPQARRWLFKYIGADQHPAVRATSSRVVRRRSASMNRTLLAVGILVAGGTIVAGRGAEQAEACPQVVHFQRLLHVVQGERDKD